VELTHSAAHSLHRFVRGPAGEEHHLSSVLRLSPHPAVVEAEEIASLALFLQVDDPGLGSLRLQTEIGQQMGEQPEGVLGLLAGRTHHHQIVSSCRVPDYAED